MESTLQTVTRCRACHIAARASDKICQHGCYEAMPSIWWDALKGRLRVVDARAMIFVRRYHSYRKMLRVAMDIGIPWLTGPETRHLTVATGAK